MYRCSGDLDIFEPHSNGRDLNSILRFLSRSLAIRYERRNQNRFDL